MVPQASVQPGVPGLQGQGAQLPPGAMPGTVIQLPPGTILPTVLQLPPGTVPQAVLQLPLGAMPQTVGQLPREAMPQTLLQLPQEAMAQTVGQLPPGAMPQTVGPLPPQGVPPQVGPLPPQGVPPIVVQVTPEGLPTILGHVPPGEQQLPLLQLLPGGMKPGMPPPNAPAHCWQHLQRAGKRQRQSQQSMGPRSGAVFHGKAPQAAGSCPLQAPSHPGPSMVPQAPPVQQQVLPVPCTVPASWETAMGPFADAVAHTQEQWHPAPTTVYPHPTTAPLGCSSAALEWDGEFGSCAAGGRLSAPGGCGKAGIAPLGMFLLFQR
ncbi:hypothetical protein CIB84_011715 [Bambusicola thoracicus]|uniref:Uncharacterized protein n=1 Tax=Bambusicola thoracicus TaxID=9083 RepID=A0A2P4SKA4_BAMTH|nr:hypothetical protein CIB84_011715 [Bambusicola thoracicus]